MADQKFAAGIYADRPHQNAPTFIIATLSIKVEDAIAFLRENEKQSGYVDLDIKESKEGKWYVALNEYQAKERTERAPREPKEIDKGVQYPDVDLDPDSIPF